MVYLRHFYGIYANKLIVRINIYNFSGMCASIANVKFVFSRIKQFGRGDVREGAGYGVRGSGKNIVMRLCGSAGFNS